MIYRQLGRTGIAVSAVSFGAGPVSGWAMAADTGRQIEVVRHAIDAGINWFDTAPTYSEGHSERALGTALSKLAAHDRVHIATKVRLNDDACRDIRSFVLKSFEESLQRLQCSNVSLLQLHNSITTGRGVQPTSVTPQDVLGPGGILDAFVELRSAGVVRHLGLTGLGEANAMKVVIDSGQFDTVQTPYNLLNPSAGQEMPGDFGESNYGNLLAHCARQNMGAFAIRVFAGGALANRPPSAHTKVTKFFPLDLYQRDRLRAEQMAQALPAGTSLPEESIRFVLAHPTVTSALIGFGSGEEIDDAIRFMAGATQGPR